MSGRVYFPLLAGTLHNNLEIEILLNNFLLVILTLEISDSLVALTANSAADLTLDLKRELALSLYARGILSAGKAAEMSDLTRREFEELLGKRRIERPLAVGELAYKFEWTGSR